MIIEKPVPAAEPAGAVKVRTPLWKRRFASVSRWLHVYLSMASFAILLFFAVTGLTLNHPDWFANWQKTAQAKGRLDSAWIAPAKSVQKLEVVEYLRRTHGIKGALSDFREEAQQCAVSFKGPGYTADAFIDRATGQYDLTENRMGLVAVMNDLHKGRDSGRNWSIVIDLSAVLMTLVSLTGLALIFFLPKKRLPGLIVGVVGLMVACGAYWLWVP